MAHHEMAQPSRYWERKPWEPKLFFDELDELSIKPLNCAPWTRPYDILLSRDYTGTIFLGPPSTPPSIERVASRVLDAAKMKEWKVVNAPTQSFSYVNQYKDGSFTCTCPTFVIVHKTCKHITDVMDQLTRDVDIDKFLEQSREALNEGWRRIANLPQPKVRFEDRQATVHLLYNTNAGGGADYGSFIGAKHRPVNDYLCGALKLRADAVLHNRFPLRSQANLDDFTRVPAEVTCRNCWQKIRLLSIAVGEFARSIKKIRDEDREIWGDLGMR